MRTTSLLALFLIGCVEPPDSSDLVARVDALEEALELAQGSITTLEGDLAQAQTSLSECLVADDLDAHGEGLKAWVEKQGYTTADELGLDGYVTDKEFASASDSIAANAAAIKILQKDALTAADLEGYATESWVSSQGYGLATDISTNAADITGLDTRLTAVEGDYFTTTSHPELDDLEGYLLVDTTSDEIVFEGANVYIQSGSMSTDDGGTLTGLGNLIVGYAENTSGAARTGSHNLVVGTEHGWTSYGGVVFGTENTITAEFAGVVGGWRNTASGERSLVSGGQYNDAQSDEAVVSGGSFNTAAGDTAWVGGGAYNTALELTSAVSGGYGNIASGQQAGIFGGYQNTATAERSAVFGGLQNLADDYYAVVAGGRGGISNGYAAAVYGGYNNTARGEYSVVAGGGSATVGDANYALGDLSAVFGGYQNTTSGEVSVITGGLNNYTSNEASAIIGGRGNETRANYATVSGGYNNLANGTEAVVTGGISNTSSGYRAIQVGGSAQACSASSGVCVD